MAHELHVYLRTIRTKRGILLKNMADDLKLGSAELSQIEQGKKPMPDGFMDKIQNLYLKENNHG